MNCWELRCSDPRSGPPLLLTLVVIIGYREMYSRVPGDVLSLYVRRASGVPHVRRQLARRERGSP